MYGYILVVASQSGGITDIWKVLTRVLLNILQYIAPQLVPNVNRMA